MVAALLYRSGLRLMEAVRLRVKDLDFDREALLVRDGKGGKDRVVTLARELIGPVDGHLAVRRGVHQRDLERGVGSIELPFALARKYPLAATEWGWLQYVFAASHLSRDPRSDIVRGHHLDAIAVQKAVIRAIRRTGIVRPASCHTLHHSFATPPGGGRGHSHGAGATGSRGPSHHAGVHACARARRDGGSKPSVGAVRHGGEGDGGSVAERDAGGEWLKRCPGR